VSVGHVARILEGRGIATVVVMVGAFAHHAMQMRLPRTMVTGNPMGRPLGPPGEAGAQRGVLKAALGLIDTADAPGTLLRLDGRYRPGRGNS
jgi:hypothetical protein